MSRIAGIALGTATAVAAVLALMVSVHVGVVDANRRVPPAAGSTILVLPAVFGLAIAALGIASVLRFHRRPDIRR